MLQNLSSAAVVIGALRVTEKLSKFTFPKTTPTLTHCLLVSSADILYSQLGTISGPTKCRASCGYQLFHLLVDSLMVFMKEFFEKGDFHK